MRLQKHLTEKVDKKTLSKGIKFLAKKYKVDPKYLIFQFEWDVGAAFKGGSGGLQLHFEITDPNHKSYGSTVAYKIS